MALDTRRLAGDFAFALISQAVGLLVGFANTLLLPKAVSIDTYGYWQLFLFYAGYTSIFSFGLVDGVYLILGGRHRADLDKPLVNSQFWFCVGSQLIIAALLIAVGLSQTSDAPRTAVIVGVAIYLVLFNADNFLGYLFQAIGETRRYSMSIMLESLSFFLGLIGLIAGGATTFEPYVGAYIVSRVVRLAWCLYFARDVLGAGFVSFKATLHSALASMAAGVKLLVSTLSGMLIIGIARFLIDLRWGIEDFAIVSFAMALAYFFMNFTSQAAMVLFPALRRVSAEELARLFVSMRDALSLLLPLVYVLYVPFVALLGLWLPRYAASFQLFALLLPLCVFNGKMDVVGMTMLKVLRLEGRLLAVNVVACAVSAAGSLVGTYLLHSIDFIILWIVACVIGRCLYAEWSLSRDLCVDGGTVMLGAVAVTLVAVLANSLLPPLGSEVIIVVAYGLYLALFHGKTAEALSMVRSALSRKERP